jgi:hypothetical protein
MKHTARSTARTIVVSAAFVALAAIAPAAADTNFGVRTGIYTDASAAFVGGEIVTSISSSNWYFNPNLEVAVADGRDVITANGDFHYDFVQGRPIYVWAGGGPALIHREIPEDADHSDIGVNFLGGIAWKTSSKVLPYLQGKVTVSDNDEAVLAFGVRF